MRPLILASRSPRRAELLAAAGIPFEVRVADVDESVHPGESPRDYVLRMAEDKTSAANCHSEIVLGADTTVVVGGTIFGKPGSRDEAVRMLTTLSGRQHEVLTGICLAREGRVLALDYALTAVWFVEMTVTEIERYVDSGEPMDKAGAYAIQGLASRWIERIEGSYSNVVGLPIALLFQRLKGCGFAL